VQFFLVPFSSYSSPPSPPHFKGTKVLIEQNGEDTIAACILQDSLWARCSPVCLAVCFKDGWMHSASLSDKSHYGD
jgi:hypothetical protein